MTTLKDCGKLKKYGFMWGNIGGTVDALVIHDVVPAANGFTVIYKDNANLVASTVVVKSIDFPKEPKVVWARVYFEQVVDESRNEHRASVTLSN